MLLNEYNLLVGRRGGEVILYAQVKVLFIKQNDVRQNTGQWTMVKSSRCPKKKKKICIFRNNCKQDGGAWCFCELKEKIATLGMINDFCGINERVRKGN